MLISGEGPLLAALRKDSSFGPRAAKIIAGKETFHPENEEDVKIFLSIFSMMFSEDPELCRGARNFLKACDPRPPVSFMNQPEIASKLNHDGSFHRWMIDQLAKNNVAALKTWSVVIWLCGSVIHTTGTGTTIINNLLQIVEKGFKHSNVEVRKSAYKSWIALMDNFAENPTILTSSKRIKLITRPLIGAISQRTEEQIRTKFDAWWHYLGLFKDQLAANVETVVLPFLQFCYSNIGPGHSAGQSPAKKFVSLRSLCLEAMAIIVSGPNRVKASQVDIGAMLDCLKDGSGVIKAAGFVKEHKVLLSCASEAFSMMRFDSKMEVGHMTEIWLTLGSVVKDLCMVSSEMNKEAVQNFLLTSQNLLVSLDRQLSQDENLGAVSLALTIVDSVSKLPTPALVCRNMTPPRNDPLSVVMIEMMLRPNLVAKVVFDADLNKYNSIFERFVDPFGQQRLDGLAVFHQFLNLVSANGTLKITHMATLWKIIAKFFEHHLFKFETVNQAKNNLDLDLSASEAILLFPFQRFLSLDSKQVWNQWNKLFKQFVMSAATATLYQDLHMESFLASKMASDLHGKQVPIEDFSNLTNLSRCLAENVVESLKSQSHTSGSSDSSPTSDNWKAVAQLLNYLSTLALKTAPEKSPPTSFALSCDCLCKQMTMFVESTTAKPVLQDLIVILAPGISSLIDHKLIGSLGSNYMFKAENLFSRTASVLEAKFEGSFSHDFLVSVQIMIVTALSHPKQKISTRARNMWKITWAHLPAKSIPADISVHLKDSGPFTDISSSSGSQDTPPVVISTPTSFRSSFLDRTKQTESPNFLKPSSATKKPSVTKSLFGLEDENSSDFVKISPASKKRRPLTEHQKEKLSTRSDDIPALYSEVSRDDTSVKLPTVFDSQLSIDESSMMAMDASDVQMPPAPVETKEEGTIEVVRSNSLTHENKRKQAHPHKTTPALKKPRGRKRKLDDDSVTETTAASSNTSPLTSSATKRGRPPRKQAVVDTNADTSKTVNVSIEKSVAPSIINSQLTNAPQVNVNRIEVNVSPVKILQENPLLVAPTPNSTSVARKINFAGNPEDGADDKSTANDGNSDDVDVIESSQSSDSNAAKHTAKRKRKSLHSTAESKPLMQRPNSRRSALLLHSSSANSSGEAKTSVSTAVSGSFGKENNAPDKDVDNVQRNQYGETELHTAVKRKNLERVKQLLDSGFNVNVKDHFGWTPLHESLNDDPTCIKIMKMLVGKGADVNAKASNGTTPLHDALQLTQEIIDFLVDNGADPEIKDDNGKSAKDLAPSRFSQQLDAEIERIPDTEDLAADIAPSSNATPSEDPVTKPTGEHHTPATEGIEVDHQPDSVGENLTVNTGVDVTQENADPKAVSSSEVVKDVEEFTAPPTPTAASSMETPTKPLIKPPLPFSSSKLSRQSSTPSLSKMSRGARFIEMSKAKSATSSPTTSVMSPSVTLMSPKPEAEQRAQPREEDLMTTPTQTAMPWQKYAPSPMNASPGGSILKRTSSEKNLAAVQDKEPEAEPINNAKTRRVHFPDNPVSDQVEIPRCPSGKATRQRLNDSKFNQMFLPKNQLKFNSETNSQKTETDSIGSYEATPDLTSGQVSTQSSNCIYPALVNCDEPIFTVMPNLANKAWMKAAERNLNENCIFKISDLARLSKMKAHAFDKYLKAPDSVTTIREALRKFEKSLKRRETEKHGLSTSASNTQGPASTTSSAKIEATVPVATDEKAETVEASCSKKTGIASIVEESTPEEEDETMRQIYDRPSPSSSPTDGLSATKESDSESLVNPILTQFVICEHSIDKDAEAISLKSSNSGQKNDSQLSTSQEVFEQDGQAIIGDAPDNDVESMSVDDPSPEGTDNTKGHHDDVGNDVELNGGDFQAREKAEPNKESDASFCSSQESDAGVHHVTTQDDCVTVCANETTQISDKAPETPAEDEAPDYDKWIKILKRRNSKSEVLSFVKKLIDLSMEMS